MIDTHAHLSSRLTTNFELPKINKVVLAASCIDDSKENIQLARKYPGKLFAAVGIHPQEINDDILELEKILSENSEIVAVGECGLEFTDGVDKEAQIKLFKLQIELAKKYDKPLIVHSRKAADEILTILKSYQNLRGVIHCYTGGKKRIVKYLEISDEWYFGIDGNITYEIGLEEVVKYIPKDRLILETDSPFLTPIPFRGETNKPDYVEYVYKKVADIWGMSFEETEKIIDGNAMRLFNMSF